MLIVLIVVEVKLLYSTLKRVIVTKLTQRQYQLPVSALAERDAMSPDWLQLTGALTALARLV
jgi:hypothetical protein